MDKVKELIRMAAGSESTVLVTGESGTGKELVAAAVHRLSGRSDGPFVAVNCAALSETLLESELFGHEKGAFTGATQRKLGRFERANGGTLFLDEIAEMSPNLQARLLRVLQDGTFERVGGERTLRTDARVVAATNRDLQERIGQGAFREDLYFRLNVVQIALPPLRDRPEDLPCLTRHFLQKHGQDRSTGVSEEVVRILGQYHWPGNVRELENVVQRALLFARGKEILPEHLPPPLDEGNGVEGAGGTGVNPGWTLEEVERDLIEKTLRQFNGNRTHAARALGLSRCVIQLKIKKFGLEEL